MAKLKATLTKGEFEGLDESLKTFYIESGEGYLLDAEGVEDVSGLKAKRDELLKDLKAKADLLKQFEGLDADAARKALDEMEKLEEQKLLSKQKFDEVLAKREKEFNDKLKAFEERYNRRFSSDADKDLQIKLIAAGVREDRAEDLAIILKTKNIKAVDNDGVTDWRTLDTDESVELEKYIPGLKESKADYFKPNGATGSGASGSNSFGGGVDLDKMSPEQMLAFANSQNK